MGSPRSIDIGFYPERLEVEAGDITLTTRSDLDESVAKVRAWPTVQGDWIYALDIERIFPLPVTHTLSHANADGPEHLDFIIWALSFFAGMRLTATEAGFVDATPIVPGKLCDFSVRSGREFAEVVGLAERYWQAHRTERPATQRWESAVHALLLAQYPKALPYEEFIYLYIALDACFVMMESAVKVAGKAKPSGGHPNRIPWMCGELGMPVPSWADGEISGIRNFTIHEGLFMGVPLGFAGHDRKSAENLSLEMGNLVSRLLVAILGAPNAGYVRSPVTSYQRHGLDLRRP